MKYMRYNGDVTVKECSERVTGKDGLSNWLPVTLLVNVMRQPMLSNIILEAVLLLLFRVPSVCVCVQNFTSNLLCLYLLQLWTDFDVQGV